MLDAFILIVIVWSLYSGWQNGFIKELISTGGYLVGLFLAATIYKTFGSYLGVTGSQTNIITSVIAFLILWVAAPIVLGLVANMLTKAIKSLSLGMVNSALGAVVSFIKFFLLLGCMLTAMSTLRILNYEHVASSKLYAPVQANFGAFVRSAFNLNIDRHTGVSSDAAFEDKK